ncbi:DMT family transporter [Marinococcus sp. PL1-022]|uniref:DMT family transporter n=1 Tax=Marinococcus sp. PL1-022 TaxID=3095363 RepID=UPI0029C2AA0A|nr:DMT family transporter [Marinococcus sp. PL1-022]MDX6152934.1 DMT family transporter [Marinococcus sp. PL1-022]
MRPLEAGKLYGSVMLVMLMWGLNVVALKVLVAEISPVYMQAARILLAGLSVALFVFLRKEHERVPQAAFMYILLAAVFGMTGHHTFLAIGLSETTAVKSSLILALLPITTALLSMLFLGDAFTKLRWLGVFAGFAGAVLINVTGEGGGAVQGAARGDAFIFAAMTAQAVSFLFIKKASELVAPRVLTIYTLMLGSVGLFVVSFVLSPSGWESYITAPGWVWLVFLLSGIFATGLGQILYNASISKIGPGKTAIFNNFVPFFGLLSSALILGENVSPAQLGGFVFIVAGVLLGTGWVEQLLLKKRKQTSAKRHA